MKRPPVPIIINLLLLTAGYFYGAYLFIEEIIFEMPFIGPTIILFTLWLFLTFCIIVTYIAVFKRHGSYILFFGTILLLLGIFGRGGLESGNLTTVIIVSLFFIMGILFVTWGILLFRNRNSPENISPNPCKKYRSWLYSAIVFFAAGVLCSILDRYFENLPGNYDFQIITMSIIIGCILIMSITQLIIYYVLCKLRERREKKNNWPEDTGIEKS